MVCGGIAVYESVSKLRKCTTEEDLKYGADEQIVRARKAISYTADPRLAASIMAMNP